MHAHDGLHHHHQGTIHTLALLPCVLLSTIDDSARSTILTANLRAHTHTYGRTSFLLMSLDTVLYGEANKTTITYQKGLIGNHVIKS